MLTYGASLEEVPPVKEIILEVRMAYMELNHEAIALIENKNKVSIAFMYKGEDLSHVCGDARRICYRVFRKKIDDTSVHLTVNSIFQLPFSSTFPMASPSLELYVMLESLSNLRRCVASARISLGRRCRSLSSLLSTNSYTLYLGTNSVTEAGSFLMNVRLGHTSVKAKSFSFYWSQELRLGLDEHKLGRNFPNFPTKAGEDARATLTILRQTRKTLFEHRVGAISVPVSRKPEFDLKGLTARIDELLVQMERDGIIVVPMITRLKAGDCSANRFASFFLDSHPYRILATTPIPFFSPDTVMKAMDASIHERTSTHGFLGWDRCLSNTFDYLLDRAAFLDSTTPSKSGLCLASNTSLHKCVLSTCQAVSCASTYSFYAAQFAVQILEEAIFEPTADSVLIGALPFDSTQESTDLKKFEQADTDRGDHSSQKDGPDKKPVLPPVKHTHLREIRSSMDTWRHRCYFRRLPSEHPLQIFALFKRDQLFVSRQAIGQSRSGILLAILVLGDENVDVEEASKLYGVEIQTQRMINDAIVALKKRAAQGTTGKTKSTQRRSLTSLNTVLMTAVDYKGFRVVVLPLPESIPEVVAWPQPLSARVRHEVSFIETKLNICNLLKPVSSERYARDVTILLSVKNRGTDTMMLYRTCYALPLFSGKDVSGPRPSVSQRLRTVPFEYSADMEMALKNSQQVPPQMTAKPTQPDQTYQDAIVRSPFSRLYSPVDELVHFITRSYSRSYRENVEPVICGNSLPGRKAQRLGTIVKSVVLDDAIAELERMDPYSPHDSISVTNFLHRRGINMRLLGVMCKRTRSPWLQHMLLVEIVARTLKQLLKGVIRRLVFCTNLELEPRGMAKAVEEVGSLLRVRGHEQDIMEAANADDTESLATSDDSVHYEDLVKEQEGRVMYSKESLLREKFLELPLFVASRLLDDSPYLLDLTRHRFRVFSWTDIVALNLFNVTIGSCTESEEFWRSFLCHRCSKLFDLEASMVWKHRVYLPALYISLQQHCGINFFPCAATVGKMLGKAFPLMPSHIRSWVPKLARSVIVPSSLPLISVVRDPSLLPLANPSGSTIIQSPSPAQNVVSRLIGHVVLQCSSPLWHTRKDTRKGLSASTIASMYSTTQGHPLLIAQDSWDVEDATVELIGVALRYEAWDVGHLLAQRCILQYPEAHAASVPARLLLLLAATHGSAEPPPKAQLALTAHRIQRVLEYHWGGHHPAALDVIVVRAWLSYLGHDWRECISGLQAALYLSAALSVSIEPQDLTTLKQLLAVTATDETSKIPAGIPPAPITPKMAGLLRMLAHSKLVLAFDRRSYIRRELMTEEQRASMANSSCMMLQWALDAYDFHFGTRHVMTLTAAREFSMSLLLLIKATKKDAGGTILQRGVDIASQTLQWQVKTLGKHHLETLTTGQLLAVLLANQGRYRRCIAMYEAVIRNAFTRLTLKPSLRRYRPDNEFSRVCWCLPDPYFYGIFETIRPFNRFFLEVKCVLPNLEDEQALVSLNKQPSAVMCGSPNESTGLPLSGGPVSSKPSGREGIGAEKQDAGDIHTKKEVPRDNGVIQLDPADHPIFPSMQSKSASDMISPAIPDLVSDMFVVYINFAVEKQLVSRLVSLFLLLDYLEKQSFRAVSYDVFEIAYTKSGGDVTSHSFLTWLLDLSGTSDKQVMEYIEHYPFRIPREQLLDQDSDIMFLLCHPREDSKGSPPCGCIMDRYLRHLLSKSEVAVSNTCQLILSGNSKKLFEVAQSYAFPLEKLKRAISKLKVVMLMLGKLKEKKDPKEKQDEPDISQMFKRQSTAQAAVSRKLQERVTIGGSFVEQLAENVKETSNRTEMRRRYRHFLAHMRTTLRLPTNLRCEELDILANLMYYYLDIHTFHTWWENRQRSGPDPATRIPRKVTEEDVSAFEEY